ncbi:MAG: thermonuclease family protein [Calothrix sp. FI2-JRJ7]|nr:thermonuclease family protein [Calothrix sp. FI2-JRJ7]
MLKKLIAVSPLLVIGALAYLSFSPKNPVNGQAPVLQRDSGFWTVLSVADGDTIKIKTESGEIKDIRFCGIDSPEKTQTLGAESKANLQRLIAEVNNKVIGYPVEVDRYGRTVAEVFTSKGDVEKFLNEEQVRSGNAYIYRQYLGKCANKGALEKAEEIAKNQRNGVWFRNDLIKPWDYRKSRRS